MDWASVQRHISDLCDLIGAKAPSTSHFKEDISAVASFREWLEVLFGLSFEYEQSWDDSAESLSKDIVDAVVKEFFNILTAICDGSNFRTTSSSDIISQARVPEGKSKLLAKISLDELECWLWRVIIPPLSHLTPAARRIPIRVRHYGKSKPPHPPRRGVQDGSGTASQINSLRLPRLRDPP
jgi:hypothetical protein